MDSHEKIHGLKLIHELAHHENWSDLEAYLRNELDQVHSLMETYSIEKGSDTFWELRGRAIELRKFLNLKATIDKRLSYNQKLEE